MAVLIKDGEIPKNCYRCRFFVEYQSPGISYYCSATEDHNLHEFEEADHRPDWCPLIEVG